MWLLALDVDGLLNPITSLDFENCTSSRDPNRRAVSDEKGGAARMGVGGRSD